jgi:hypothetical protein
MNMTPNIGKLDRLIRYVLGFGLLSLFFILEGSVRFWGLLGIIPLVTAVFEICPVMRVLGINTRGHPPSRHHPAH